MTATSTNNDKWKELTFSGAVQVNPSVGLKRGEVYPFVGMASVDGGQRAVSGVEDRVFKGSGSKFQNGDTLMARITPCLENGKIARYQPLGDQQQAHGSTEFIVLRGRTGTTTDDFAYYLTRWEEVHQYAIGQMTGTSGRQRVPVDSLDHLTVPIPPLHEQRTIAHILGTLDDKIELNRSMNETLEEMARALFKSWFVDFEPVRAKLEGRWRCGESLPGLPADIYNLFPDRLVPSEMGKIPEGWEVRPLGEVVEQLRDNENPQASPDMAFSHFSIPAFDRDKTPVREWGSDIMSAKTRIQSGVVLMSKLNPEIERVWLVDVEPNQRAVCSTEFLVLRALPPLERGYIYCLVRSPQFREQVESLVTGTSKSHQRSQAGAVLSLQVVIPPELVSHEFDKQASAFLVASLSHRREVSTLATQRDVLLPKLVSGEVRVP